MIRSIRAPFLQTSSVNSSSSARTATFSKRLANTHLLVRPTVRMGQGAVSFPPLTSEILDKIRQISATWKARGPGKRILTHSPADTSEGRAPGREGRLPLPPRGKEGLRQTLSGKTPDKTPVTDTNDGMANRAGREPETSLYDAVKAFLE